jgi:hypothetical protein
VLRAHVQPIDTQYRDGCLPHSPTHVHDWHVQQTELRSRRIVGTSAFADKTADQSAHHDKAGSYDPSDRFTGCKKGGARRALLKPLMRRKFLVPQARLERAHPCGYQILSLARLPIPPLGLPGPKGAAS